MIRSLQQSFFGRIQADALPVGKKQNVLLIDGYDLDTGVCQLTIPVGKVIDLSPDGIRQQMHDELRDETSSHVGRLEKLIDFHSHAGYIAHKVHMLVAYDLECDPLEMEKRYRCIRSLWMRRLLQHGRIISAILKLS